MIVSYDQTWIDQRTSWWAKANRAKEHIDSLRRLVGEFRASSPYSLTPEPTDIPGRLAYRLRFTNPVPVVISTTVGDVLHNLRAALENLAFEVALRSQSKPLSPSQEKASAFPICATPRILLASSRRRRTGKASTTPGREKRSARSSPSRTWKRSTRSALHWTGLSRTRSAGANCTGSTPCGTSKSTVGLP